MMNYYREPEGLSEALRYAANAEDESNEHTKNLAVYFFSRLVQLQPSVASQYEAALEYASDEGRVFITKVLRLASRDSAPDLTRSLELSFPTAFDALERPITHPFDLDYLWCEFFITGSKEPVRRIAEVLRWPDIVRQKLEAWLKQPASGVISRWKRKRTIGRLRSAGIPLQESGEAIEGGQDLDCLCTVGVYAACPAQGQFSAVRAILPFEISLTEANRILTKACAKWSLVSNASQHSIVSETCREESKDPYWVPLGPSSRLDPRSG
jgi:hypothetical protein